MEETEKRKNKQAETGYTALFQLNKDYPTAHVHVCSTVINMIVPKVTN